MRPSALSSGDYTTLSGFNYGSSSPKTNTPLGYKGFGYYFNSPKSEAQKDLTYSTRLKNDSNRYSHKAERPLDTSVEKRSAKTREYSATRTPGSTYSGFYDSDKNYSDMKKSTVDLFKPGQTYTSGLRGTSASPLSRSTFIREATREDANILTRKKYDIETSTPSQARNPSDLRPSSSKHGDNNSRWEDSTPKKGTVTYYPLEDFINKYSPSRNSNTSTAAQNTRYASDREKNETPVRSSLTQSRVMASASTRPTSATAMKYSMYDSSVNTSPFSTTTPTKFNSYFERQASNDVDSNNRSSGTSNFLNTYEIKKYDY